MRHTAATVRRVASQDGIAAAHTNGKQALLMLPSSHTCGLYCPQDREAKHARTHYSRGHHGQVA